MTTVLVECDGVRASSAAYKGREWDHALSVRTQGAQANRKLRVQPPSDALKGNVAAHAADLLRIAAYVYWADQRVSRGGEADVMGDDWKRLFLICAPVSDPDFWNADGTRGLLGDALQFLTEDIWLFEFGTAHFDEQLSLDTNPRESRRNPDVVSVFSGGADSLCAAAESAIRGHRPVLVSHHPTTFFDSKQRKLARLLAQQFANTWHFPHTAFLVQGAGEEARDNSQRSRAFLYGSMGAAVAHSLGIREVVFADNGIISLNLPINDQLLGALASRATHPKFISRFNRLIAHVISPDIVATNPLQYRTRAESLAVLRGHGLSDLLQETISCSRWRGLPKATPHCGECSQCIDRRFASLAAEVEEHDLGERYRTDVFLHSLEGQGLTTAISYVRFARTTSKLGEEELFLEYPQLEDCVLPDEPEPQLVARRLAEMTKRHAREVLSVLEGRIEHASQHLVLGELPTTCLVRLAITAEGETPEGPPVAAIELAPEENAEFDTAGFQSRMKLELTGRISGRRGNLVRIQGKEVEFPDSEFRLFLRICVGVCEEDEAWIPVGQLEREGLVAADGLDRELYRLRTRVGGALLPGLSRLHFLQRARGRVRLSTHRRFLAWDDDGFKRHPDESIRRLAGRLEACRSRTSRPG
ncbi:MAG: hypothetical protein WEC75_14975 [Dehalococcoidia bacterium]